ncbi:lyase family protein [Gryllotalpicola ginsengisoli]|uniref:lyase family protein n=1 Tax=Gryllotalpicola ginsengisoli TaxID=444608 RepID=UPI0004104A9E|nr:lyase family protein [Gryllotalpicola ginsengisoli]
MGLLEPVSAGHDAVVSDSAVLEALLAAERALVRAAVALELAPAQAAAAFDEAIAGLEIDAAELATDAAAGGNPVIPLLSRLRPAVAAVDESAAEWVHRGATSQDIVDTALALISVRAAAAIDAALGRTVDGLAALAAEHRDTVAAARTLGQHSTPTTWGLRFALWAEAVLAARGELREASAALPAQLGGASGTLASFVALYGEEAAARLPGAYAAELSLAAPQLPWHVTRRPFTRLADALVAVVDALGVIGSDVALASRTEVGELIEPQAPGRGGSSAMPHKRNPILSVLIRSAALRAPGLGADLHRAAALAVDERPDGAWHSEWPALRELLRLALGASAQAAELSAGLRVVPERVAANLAISGDELLSEQRKLTGRTGEPESYTGLAGAFVDRVLAGLSQEER